MFLVKGRGEKKMHILLLILFLAPLQVQALVTCSPSSCSPGCDETCEYKTCGLPSTVTFVVGKLPHTYLTPANACADALDGAVFSKLPIDEDDVHINVMQPTSVTHKFQICQTRTESGPACPPPPTPTPSP